MFGPKVAATGGSTAIGGSNHGVVVNANDNAIVQLNFEHKIALELPSFLGDVIGLFSKENISQYDDWKPDKLLPEVIDKLNHNEFPEDHPLISDWLIYGLVLDRAYKGAEQQNSDARLMVRRRAGITYTERLRIACKAGNIPLKEKLSFVRNNAEELIEEIIIKLLSEYRSSKIISVHQETAHLAISLIVADALIECKVLERL